MRLKPALALLWLAGTVLAVTIVWQSLRFVSSTETGDDASSPIPTTTTSTTTATDPATTSTAGTVATNTSTSSAPSTVATTDGTTPVTAETTCFGPITEPPPGAVDQPFQLVGGSTLVRYFADGGVTVLWAIPETDFSGEIESEGAGCKVEFESEGHRSRIAVWWDGGPQHTIEERPD